MTGKEVVESVGALSPAPSPGGWGEVLGELSASFFLCSICQELKLLHCSSLATERDSLLACSFWPRA